MKLLVFICFAVFYTNATNISPETLGNIVLKVKEIIKPCVQSTGATEDDAINFMGGKTPTSKEGKCMVACFYKEAGLGFENGEIKDNNGFGDAIKSEDPDFYAAKLKITQECHSEIPKSDDDCEYYAKMYECNVNKSKEAKIAFSLFSRK
uniref:Odorant binding protein 4 n=1 Tax=Agrilus mali TaxID=1917227 RepID=A0A2R4H1I6_9COLE|nr:odorant binding protein 4 [Agrilus mali]